MADLDTGEVKMNEIVKTVKISKKRPDHAAQGDPRPVERGPDPGGRR